MVSKSARCGMCFEIIDGDNWNEIEEDYAVYCNNEEWDIPGGSCWQQRVVMDFPEMESWLWLSFECDGDCTLTEEGECSCTNGF